MADLAGELRRALAQAGAAGLAAAAQAALGGLRGLDEPGAAAVMAGDPECGRLLAQAVAGPEPRTALDALAVRLAELAAAARCLGCATCCRVSSPTLYAEDLDLVRAGGLPRAALYTLRRGEMVFSARLGSSQPLERELIKLREAPGGGCAALAGNACGLYAHRPLQCRHLECWSGRHAGQLAARPRLTRRDLLAGDDTALALLAEYEARLPGAALAQALHEAASGRDAAPALAMLELDHRLRCGIEARYGYAQEAQHLILGRPARLVALAHGLELALDGRGRPCLVARRAPAGGTKTPGGGK
ncbi:MAG: YkgJ family cysteine cluster protein [Thermodesulfobacteriota bacterium]